jgi:hypothetical protein
VRVACIKDGVVVNVIEVDSLDKVPNVIGVDEEGKLVVKNQVKLVETEVGSKDDLYIEGKGFYRFIGL